ncbi:Uncharacterized protein SCF082_LOCUS40838, partial [Durusdinium trenchii]
QDMPDDYCMFKDARLLRSDARRVCTVHGGPCRLPSVIDGFGAGFSCTSYSSLNKDAAKNASAMEKASRNEAEGRVASVTTFMACCDVLEISNPTWAIFENVQAIDRESANDEQTNLDLCLQEIDAKGYACQTYLLDDAWYGLPQSRRRVYLDRFLLADDDPAVTSYLQTLQEEREKQRAKEAERPSEKNPSWISLHMSLAE